MVCVKFLIYKGPVWELRPKADSRGGLCLYIDWDDGDDNDIISLEKKKQ